MGMTRLLRPHLNNFNTFIINFEDEILYNDCNYIDKIKLLDVVFVLMHVKYI